jgi:Holliday junction resolvase
MLDSTIISRVYETGTKLSARFTRQLTHRQLESLSLHVLKVCEPSIYATRADAALVANSTARVFPGWPDIICIAQGMLVGVELKVGADQLRLSQQAVKATMARNGGDYNEVRSLEDLYSVIENLPEKTFADEGWSYKSKYFEEDNADPFRYSPPLPEDSKTAGRRVIQARGNLSESEIQTRILNYLVNKSIPCTITNAQSVGRRPTKVRPGWPDITAVLPNGQALLIEVKARAGKLDLIQASTLNALKRCGAGVVLAKSVRDVEEALSGKI